MVGTGDVISKHFTAAKFNDFDAVARAYREGRLQQLPGSQTGAPPFEIKNDTSEDLPAGSILGLSGVSTGPVEDLDDFRFATIPTGVTPDIDDHKGRFAVLLDSVGAGDIGPAAVSGLAVCKVNIVTEGDQFADVKDGDNTQLQSGGSGCRIIPAETGTGTKWCLALLGSTAGDVFWQFTLTENMGATTSNQASATKLNIDGSTTGETITVLDATPNSMWENLESGDSGWCFERGGEYHILYSEGVGSGDTIWQFTLTEDMGATTTDEGAASLLTADGTDASTSITVIDGSPNSIFSVLTSGSSGWCFEQGGSYYIIQAECADSSSDTSGFGPFYQAFNVF